MLRKTFEQFNQSRKLKNMSGERGIVCVAYGCSNTTLDNESMDKFPMKKPGLLRQWMNFVKSKQKDWEQPSAYSTLCSDHFTEDCFPVKYCVMESMGQSPQQKRLKPGSVPTIHTKTEQATPKRSFTTKTNGCPCDETPTVPKKTRTAFEKREKRRVSSIFPTYWKREI